VGPDVLLLVGGEAGAAGDNRKQDEKTDDPCGPDRTIRHDRPLGIKKTSRR